MPFNDLTRNKQTHISCSPTSKRAQTKTHFEHTLGFPLKMWFPKKQHAIQDS